jgi:hypothetical protein
MGTQDATAMKSRKSLTVIVCMMTRKRRVVFKVTRTARRRDDKEEYSELRQ